MKCVVTGSAGFIGSHLCESLLAAGHEVTGGAQLESSGRQVRGKEKVVAEGPVSPDPLMGGFFIVSAASLEQATALAKGCPVLQSGGTVEVRPLMPET